MVSLNVIVYSISLTVTVSQNTKFEKIEKLPPGELELLVCVITSQIGMFA